MIWIAQDHEGVDNNQAGWHMTGWQQLTRDLSARNPSGGQQVRAVHRHAIRAQESLYLIE